MRLLIEVKGLHFSYGEREILKGIDLSIKEGERVVIGGRNGSGKTTLVKHFNGLLYPNSGSVKVKGKETRDYSRKELVKRVGLVFQNPDHQIFSESVRGEIEFGAKKLGTTINLEKTLSDFGLAGFENKHPSLLSRGQRKRLSIASIVAYSPDVLILDEPFIGQDQKSRKEILKILNDLKKTVMIVTHDPCDLEEFAERAVILVDGAIEYDGGTRRCTRTLRELL